MTHPCTITDLVRHKIPFEAVGRKVFTLEEILHDVCTVQGQKINEVMSVSRRLELVICKRLFYFIARRKTHHSTKYIGRFMNSDHTTVLHHSQTVTDYLKVKEPKWMIIWEHYLQNSKLFNKNDF